MFKQNSVNVHAVKNVSFTIKQGEIFGIVGASGAGKSTLLRTINLLQPITDGQVIVDNKAIEHYKGESLRSLRQNIGMVFQHFNLANSKTVYENVAFALQGTLSARTLWYFVATGMIWFMQRSPSTRLSIWIFL